MTVMKGRWKQVRGRCRKAWGRLMRDPFEEFRGERDIVDGKLEEHYSRIRIRSSMAHF